MASKPLWQRRCGLVKVRIHRSRRKSRLCVSIIRLYRNGPDWYESNRFSRDDIPVIRMLLDEAYAWLHTHASDTQTP